MTKDTLPSPVTLSTPDVKKLRDGVIEAARNCFLKNSYGSFHWFTAERRRDLGNALAILDSLPSPVSVPEGDARAVAQRIVADWDNNMSIGPHEFAETITLLSAARPQWQPIETAPKDEMFIWAAPRGKGKWGLGLAYWTVNGPFRDAYGAPSSDATHCMLLPAPPG